MRGNRAALITERIVDHFAAGASRRKDRGRYRFGLGKVRRLAAIDRKSPRAGGLTHLPGHLDQILLLFGGKNQEIHLIRLAAAVLCHAGLGRQREQHEEQADGAAHFARLAAHRE